jgi:hypothetical protein
MFTLNETQDHPLRSPFVFIGFALGSVCTLALTFCFSFFGTR